MKELLLLELRNLIADKEFTIATANRELSLGGWVTDHSEGIRIIDYSINKIIEIIRENYQ